MKVNVQIWRLPRIVQRETWSRRQYYLCPSKQILCSWEDSFSLKLKRQNHGKLSFPRRFESVACHCHLIQLLPGWIHCNVAFCDCNQWELEFRALSIVKAVAWYASNENDTECVLYKFITSHVLWRRGSQESVEIPKNDWDEMAFSDDTQTMWFQIFW